MLKMGEIDTSERGPLLENPDPRFAEFGHNSAICPFKSPNFRPFRAAITEKKSVHTARQNRTSLWAIPNPLRI